MSPVMHSEAKSGSAVVAEASPVQNPVASFGTALLGFMISTTLATSLLVLLSQG